MFSNGVKYTDIDMYLQSLKADEYLFESDLAQRQAEAQIQEKKVLYTADANQKLEALAMAEAQVQSLEVSLKESQLEVERLLEIIMGNEKRDFGCQVDAKWSQDLLDAKQRELTTLQDTVRILESRIQRLTEDKDLMERELELNNSYYDNREQLLEDKANLERLNGVLQRQKSELEDKLFLIQSKFERLQSVLRAQARVRPIIQQGTFTPMPASTAPEPERMTVTQRDVNNFFNNYRSMQPVRQ